MAPLLELGVLLLELLVLLVEDVRELLALVELRDDAPVPRLQLRREVTYVYPSSILTQSYFCPSFWQT